ncbi:hypothetical protein CSOJ01_08846 [Colletotrichum sojae]|uniref:Uncharacterized protein n=1 Tax=Colletotrichum sojae TaxID=2175907 RepID=A0A8H6J5B3_9PEZI|nr:hypothetical protein CSOJ01_08846 [Colletotrichum sojae]
MMLTYSNPGSRIAHCLHIVKVPDFAKPASPSRYKYADKAEDTKPAAEKSTEEPKADIAERPETSSPGVQAQDEGKGDGRQWEVVNPPKEEQEEDSKNTSQQEGGFAGNFSLQLGWGKWKFTPLSWEVNVNDQVAHDRNQEGHGRARQSPDQDTEKESK